MLAETNRNQRHEVSPNALRLVRMTRCDGLINEYKQAA